jgi:hypothetical protein
MKLTKIIRVKNFERLTEEGVDLSSLYILELFQSGYNVQGMENVKIQGWISGLMRKGLITEDYKITLEGCNILSTLDQDLGRNTLKKVEVQRDEKFKEWWECYPSVDRFIYNNVKFPGARSLRVKQKECEVLFYKLTNEDGIKAEDIIKGTTNHIEELKKISYSSKENRLTYMPASDRYLKEKRFIHFIEQDTKNDKPIRGAIDI